MEQLGSPALAKHPSNIGENSSGRTIAFTVLVPLALLVLAGFLLAPRAAGAAEPPVPQAASGGSALTTEQIAEIAKERKSINELSDELSETKEEVSKTHTIATVALGPIAVLVGILALGGSLGIVFSVRDQRRVSQLHELTVGGEVLSQRRAEQSFASFFEQSQTTLSLVNDTLELAKEANKSAAQSMQRRAEEQVNAIEDRAENLMQRVFRERDFEKLAYESEYRSELHSIGDELRAVEGFLRLQNIELPQHAKFIKAFDQFLLDDTEAALQGLRQLSQSGVSGELRRFTLFWLGYLSTTVGEYDVAVRIFEADEVGLDKDDTERIQLECIIAEATFFETAKKLREKDRSGKHRSKQEEDEGETPLHRFEEVAPLLDKLSDLDLILGAKKKRNDLNHVALEIARTRADVYLWIAYDPERLDEPLGQDPRSEGERLPMLRDSSGLDGNQAERRLGLIKDKEKGEEPEGEATQASRTDALREALPDAVRAWALRQARAICETQAKKVLGGLNFDVVFALAESQFMLADGAAEDTIAEAERALGNEFGDYLEKRKKVSLRESELICHSRLLFLRKSDPQKKDYETRQVQQSERRAREAVSEMRQGRVTVFSHIQKRNISGPEMIKEVEAIVEQDEIED
jgi:hypothetical protein